MEQLNRYIVKELGVETINVLSEEDRNLVGSYRLGNVPFVPGKYTLDLSFYDLNGNLIEVSRNIKTYSIIGAVKGGEATYITVNPVEDTLSRDYLGDVQLGYEVFNNLFSPALEQDTNSLLFVSDISTDRTEVRAKSTTLPDNNLKYYANQVYNRLNNRSYFSEIYLDFVDEGLKAVGVNIITEVVDRELYVTFKLYEPLPANIKVKSRFAVLERIGEPVKFEVLREVEVREVEKNVLRGPNFNVDTAKVVSSTTDYLNYAELFSYPARKSRLEQYSLLTENSAQISIDYSQFKNFIHFSSAVERLENFRYKLGLIRDCEQSSSYFKAINPSDPNVERYENIKTGIISNFDHYDRYLYFENTEFAWPKEDTSRPYKNIDPNQTMPVGPDSGSIQGWWEDTIARAEAYDESNEDILVRTVPEAIAENPDNEAYLMFVHMIGQHFDNEWIYVKALSDRYNSDNRLDFGISKDLVRDAIRDFGFTLYESNQNLTRLFDLCNINGSYSTGSEKVLYLQRITAGVPADIPQTALDGEYALWDSSDPVNSVDGEYALWGSSDPVRTVDAGDVHVTVSSPTEDQPVTIENYRQEIYKRIFHNIPLLVKTKGTVRGLRALINCFGIPDDILEIRVQGGTSSSLGPLVEVTSSLSKIRLDNTGSWAPLMIESGTVISSSVLSKDISQYTPATKYFDDTSGIEIGFSLNRQEDKAFQDRLSTVNVYGDIVGNPKNAKENYGRAFRDLRRDVLSDIVQETGSLPFRTPASIIRLVRYFDSMLFRSFRDFLPARASVSSGVIVEDSILNRNRYSGVLPGGEGDLVKSGSIPIGAVAGSSGGSLDFLKLGEAEIVGVGVKRDKTIVIEKPTVNYVGGWSTAEATGSKTIFDNSPKFNGELSGSVYEVSNGEVFKHNPYRGTVVSGNPYLHAGSAIISYNLNFRFLTLPAPSDCTLSTVGSFVGVRYRIYGTQGATWYCSSGVIYDDSKSLGDSDLVLEDSGSGLTTTVDAGGTVPGITTSYMISDTTGSAVLLDGALETTILAGTGSTAATFLGWYKGNVPVADKMSRLEDYITSADALTLRTGSSVEEYTARYSADVPTTIGAAEIALSQDSNRIRVAATTTTVGGLTFDLRIRTNINRVITVPIASSGQTIVYVSGTLNSGETVQRSGISSLTSGSVTVLPDWGMNYFYTNYGTLNYLVKPVWYR